MYGLYITIPAIITWNDIFFMLVRYDIRWMYPCDWTGWWGVMLYCKCDVMVFNCLLGHTSHKLKTTSYAIDISHVDKRTSLCRRSIFRLSPSGMCYPGLEADAKAHIWNTIGAPTIQYGMECVDLSRKNKQHLSTVQTNIIKNVMGLSKRSHHTHLLQALRIPSFDQYLDLSIRRLYNRLMVTDTPAGALQTRLLARYTSTGHVIKHTLLARLLSRLHDPYLLIHHPGPRCETSLGSNGITDSLRYLVTHHNYIKPWSYEFLQVRLLLAAFWTMYRYSIFNYVLIMWYHWRICCLSKLFNTYFTMWYLFYLYLFYVIVYYIYIYCTVFLHSMEV